MNTYTPDNWVVIKINGDTPHYKVLAGWSGGYLHGSSWRMNSGIVRVEKTDDNYLFYGSTGSCYICHKETYGLRMNIAYVWNQLQKDYANRVDILDETTDWTSVDWMIKERK
jgi:hypothetical protein